MEFANITTKADPVKTRTTSSDPARAPKHDNALQELQQTVGNRALSRLLARPQEQDSTQQIQRKCSECEEEDKEEE